jgi:hypothetical protein
MHWYTGQLANAVNFQQGVEYTIVFVYTNVNCATIDFPQAAIVVNSLGFTTRGPAVVSQRGPNQCAVSVRAERTEPTTLIDVGERSPFKELPVGVLDQIRDESNGQILFQAPLPPPPIPPVLPPTVPPTSPPTVISNNKVKPILIFGIAVLSLIAISSISRRIR